MGLKQIRCTICNWLRIREQCNLSDGSVKGVGAGVRADNCFAN